MLHDADWLESATSRCDKLIDYYRNYKRIYDFYDISKLNRDVTVDDVKKYSRGYFAGPISVVTQGADFNADLGKIWHDNFK